MKTLTTIILILISLNIFSQDATIFINKYGDTCTNISYGASLIFKNTTGTSSLAIGQTSVGGFYSGCDTSIFIGDGGGVDWSDSANKLIIPNLRPISIGKSMNEYHDEWLIKRLTQYETDCFNDSTAHYYYSVSDMFESWEVQCNKGDTTIFGGICPEHWHHEEPTFKGFIKWLKQK